MLKEYEDRFTKSHKELREAKERQGVLLDSIQTYEAKSQAMVSTHQALVQKILRLQSHPVP